MRNFILYMNCKIIPLSAVKELNKFVDKIFVLLRYVGALLLAWGLGQVLLAFKDENADAKVRAMMFIFTSILLIGLETMMTKAGFIK